MNKVLVTGLALGRDFGWTNMVNYDFSWILRYPSVFLWADKIIVPSSIWQIIKDDVSYPDSKAFSQAIRIIFEMAHSEGVVEVIRPSVLLTERSDDLFAKEIQKDLQLIADNYPDKLSINENKIFKIGGHDYCYVHIKSLYASFLLGRIFDANCLLDDAGLNFAKYKYAVSTKVDATSIVGLEASQAVFESILPNTPIIDGDGVYFTQKSDCAKCHLLVDCSNKYILKTEQNMSEVLKLRTHDEINQLRSIMNNIIAKRNENGNSLNPKDIMGDLNAEQYILQKRMRQTFPKIQRWNKMLTIVSLPVALLGQSTSINGLSSAALGLASLAQGADLTIEYLKSKYSWINFYNSKIT